MREEWRAALVAIRTTPDNRMDEWRYEVERFLERLAEAIDE